MPPLDTEYPAALIVHWPTGPTPACVKHAEDLLGLAAFLATHVGVSPLRESAECAACRNEASEHGSR